MKQCPTSMLAHIWKWWTMMEQYKSHIYTTQQILQETTTNKTTRKRQDRTNISIPIDKPYPFARRQQHWNVQLLSIRENYVGGRLRRPARCLPTSRSVRCQINKVKRELDVTSTTTKVTFNWCNSDLLGMKRPGLQTAGTTNPTYYGTVHAWKSDSYAAK